VCRISDEEFNGDGFPERLDQVIETVSVDTAACTCAKVNIVVTKGGDLAGVGPPTVT
jgi:hypothetical protein